MAFIISLDIGTSTLCALAVRGEGLEPVALRSAPNRADIAGLSADRHEQDPERLWEQVRDLVADLLDDKAVRRKEVAALSITGQMHGVLLVEPDLRPASGFITWRDQRVVQKKIPGSLHEIREIVDAAAAKRTGCRLNAGYGGATLFHLVRNGGLPGGATALAITDFVAARFTGVAATEPTQAASWGLLNLQRRQWDMKTVRRLQIPAKVLPPLHESSTVLAAMRRDLARSLGLGPSLQVFVPVGDNQASVIGAAGFACDAAVVNLGTGGQVSIPASAPAADEIFETRPMPFGGYLLVGASLCGGWSYAYLRNFIQEVVREFAGVELSEGKVYEQMNRLGRSAASGAAGMKALTHFNGTRTRPEVRGGLLGIDAQNLGPANLVRAFVEGMVGELAELFRAADTTGISRIVASGNAARKNEAVVQAIESLFGLPCVVSRREEEAAFGAALAAATAAGSKAGISRIDNRDPNLLHPSLGAGKSRLRSRNR